MVRRHFSSEPSCDLMGRIAYKWQPSLNKIHVHGNDVRPVERKQNCAFSEKWA